MTDKIKNPKQDSAEENDENKSKEIIEEVSELEKEVAGTSEREFSIREVPLTQQVTPVLQPLENSQEPVQSLEAQVVRERPNREENRRTAVDYGAAFSTTNYIGEERVREQNRQERQQTGQQLISSAAFAPQNTRVFSENNLFVQDSRIQGGDEFHKVIQVETAKYENKRTFESNRDDYYAV